MFSRAWATWGWLGKSTSRIRHNAASKPRRLQLAAGTALLSILATPAGADDWQKQLDKLTNGTAVLPVVDYIQVAQNNPEVDFNIPAQALASALTAFGTQSGFQVAVDPAAIAGLQTKGITGRLPATAALDRLLEGSGLKWHFVDEHSVVLSTPEAEQGTLAPLSVTDSAMTDTATEHTGSYTADAISVGSKAPTTLRETPHSVSVVTRERLEDQNLTTLPEVLEQTTGMTVNSFDGSGILNTIFSRGFEVDLLQMDGVMVGGSQGSYATSMDMAIYDHVEVLRGPAGLLQGAGEPGGAINLVRKRALDEYQFGGMGSYGSWDSYRGEIDLTGPLVESGKLRGRLVGVYQDSDSFVDVVESDKNVVYGTFEFDLTEDTTLSIGGARQEINAVFDQGLPAFADGSLLDDDGDRHLYAGSNWNDIDTETIDSFFELEHRFENESVAKLTGRYMNRQMENFSSRANSAINPVTGNVNMQTAHNDRLKENYNLSAYYNTPVELWGLTHNFLIGADYRIEEETLRTGRGPNFVFNIFDPDFNTPEPDMPLTNTGSKTQQEEYGVYSSVRIKPTDWATLILGGRFTWYQLDSRNLISDVRTELTVDHEFTPYAGLVVDVTDELSIYGSYADVFQPQSAFTSTGSALPPRTGSQYEVGIKGEFLDGRLNSHLAFYRIFDENRAIADPDDADFSIAAGEVRSQGFETEISGEVLPGWNIVAGYAYNENEYLKDPVNEGQPFSTITPKHSANLWTKYTLQEGTFEGLSFGTGIRFLSSTSVTSGAVELKQDPYAVVDAQIGYRFNENVAANFTVNNVFDEVYYRKLGAITRQNYFGEPRAFLLTLRATW